MKTNRLKTFILYAGACLVLIACGANKRESRISGLENLPEKQRQLVQSSADKFNSLAGEEILASPHTGYEIKISVVPQKDMNEISPTSATGSSRLGYATEDASVCTIQLSDAILNEPQRDLAIAVFVHEMGHCLGMKHVSETGEIMSPITSAFQTYTAPSIERYTKAVKRQLGLERKE